MAGGEVGFDGLGHRVEGRMPTLLEGPVYAHHNGLRFGPALTAIAAAVLADDHR